MPTIDPAGLGRGTFTRRLPVLGQLPSTVPTQTPIPITDGPTAVRFTVRLIFSIKRLTFPAAIFAIIHQVGEALVPLILGFAIDRALTSRSLSQLVVWLVALGVNFLILSLAFRFAAQLTMRAVQLTQQKLRTMLSSSVVHANSRRLHQSDGAVLSTATNDVASASSAVTIGVFPVGDLAGIGFVAVALFGIYWPLGLAVAIGAPLVVLATGAFSGPYTRRKRHFQTLLATAVGQAADIVAGYRVIKGIGAEREASQRYRTSSREVLTGAQQSVKALGNYLAGSAMVSGTFVALIAGVAASFAVSGEISLGDLIAVVGLAQVLLTPLLTCTSNTVIWWAGALASSGRILELLASQPSRNNLLPAIDPAAVAAIPAMEIALAELPRIRVEPGELVGVRTEDRTAMRVIAAILDPSSDQGGQVLLDGSAAERLDRQVYRARVTVSPHPPALFTGTFAENIDLATGPSQLRGAAATAAACDDFVTVSLHGIDNQLGEGGNRLSGGQRQRVALARALATNAPMLVLHEPTTAVDSVTETVIAKGLRNIRRGRSTLVVTTSPILLGACDRVIDLPATEQREVDVP